MKEATEDIIEKITSASANYTKESTTHSGKSKSPWYNNFLKNQILKRDKLYQIYLKSKTDDNAEKYKEVKKLFQSAKKDYY